MIYLSVLCVLPAALSILIVKLVLAARHSRHRVELLEKDESYSSKLAHIVSRLEQKIENHVVDIMDKPRNISTTGSAITEMSKDKWRKSPLLGYDELARFWAQKYGQEEDDSNLISASPTVQGSTEDLLEALHDQECKWHTYGRLGKCESSSSLPSPSHESISLPHEPINKVAEMRSALTLSEMLEDKWRKPPLLGYDELAKFWVRNYEQRENSYQTSMLYSYQTSMSSTAQGSTEDVLETSHNQECGKWHTYGRLGQCDSSSSLPSPSHESTSLPDESTNPVTDAATAGPTTSGPTQRKDHEHEHANHNEMPIILTEKQREMASSLNMLPNLRKERAFLDHAWNAHGPLICRDFFYKRINRDGAIKHWAEHFVFDS
jgi:hypothetical protein